MPPARGHRLDLLSLANGQGIDLQSATTNPFTLKLITLNGSVPGLAANFDKAARTPGPSPLRPTQR